MVESMFSFPCRNCIKIVEYIGITETSEGILEAVRQLHIFSSDMLLYNDFLKRNFSF